MKNLILAILLFAMPAMAGVIEAPAYLKDGQITVTLKDGTQYSFSTNEFAVVPRVTADKEGAVAGSKGPMPLDATHRAAIEAMKPKKNRFRIVGGYGPDGVEVLTDADVLTLKQHYGAVVGIGYDYLLDNGVSIGAQAMSNKTYTLNLGLDL